MSIQFINGVEESLSTVPIYSAKKALEACAALGIDSSSWIARANTICLQEGYDASYAYLLMLGANVATLDKDNTGHIIKLSDPTLPVFDDELPEQAQERALYLFDWVYDSHEVIDPSLNPNDPASLFLVKFCDKRKLFADSVPSLSGFNIVREDGRVPDGTYDSTSGLPEDFPYDLDTIVGGTTPWTWETLLEDLWDSFALGVAYPTLVGSYPTQVPLDIRPEGRSAYRLFHDLIKSIGFELHPKTDGATFNLTQIGSEYSDSVGGSTEYHQLLDPGMTNFSLIHSTHPRGGQESLPANFRVGFLVRRRLNKYKNRNHYHFITVATSTIVSGLSPTAPTDTVVFTGTTETILTEAMTAVFNPVGTGNPENQTVLSDFATYIATQFIKRRLSESVNAIFAGFQHFASTDPVVSSIHYKVTNMDGRITYVRTFDSSVSVAPPDIDVNTDRYVCADDADAQPDELYDKLNDHLAFDPEEHQVVYAEVVPDPDPSDTLGPYNKVRLFTTLGEGGSGVEKYRLIRGVATEYSGPSNPVVEIDTIVAYASGLDPSGGDPDATLNVGKQFQGDQYEEFNAGDLIYAIYEEEGGVWYTLDERYRLLRGEYYNVANAEEKVIGVKAVDVLAWGLDPREDATDAEEIVFVKVWGDLPKRVGKKIWAAFNPNVSVVGATPVHWEMIQNEDGKDGAGGLFIVTLASDISASTVPTALGNGTGTVYEIGEGGVLTELGSRTILNPYKYSLPADGQDAVYPCSRTKVESEEGEEDDEYTITGIDVMYLLKSLVGFGEKKSLAVEEGGDDIDNIKWLGGDCPSE